MVGDCESVIVGDVVPLGAQIEGMHLYHRVQGTVTAVGLNGPGAVQLRSVRQWVVVTQHLIIALNCLTSTTINQSTSKNEQAKPK